MFVGQALPTVSKVEFTQLVQDRWLGLRKGEMHATYEVTLSSSDCGVLYENTTIVLASLRYFSSISTCLNSFGGAGKLRVSPVSGWMQWLDVTGISTVLPVPQAPSPANETV
jgi:hypothetical protein